MPVASATTGIDRLFLACDVQWVEIATASCAAWSSRFPLTSHYWQTDGQIDNIILVFLYTGSNIACSDPIDNNCTCYTGWIDDVVCGCSIGYEVAMVSGSLLCQGEISPFSILGPVMNWSVHHNYRYWWMCCYEQPMSRWIMCEHSWILYMHLPSWICYWACSRNLCWWAYDCIATTDFIKPSACSHCVQNFQVHRSQFWILIPLLYRYWWMFSWNSWL